MRSARFRRLRDAYASARSRGPDSDGAIPGTPARRALEYARTAVRESARPDLEWDSAGDRATLRFQGFDVVATCVPDDSGHSLEFIGRYARDWKPGAIDRRAAGDWDRNEFQYFLPCATRKEMDDEFDAFRKWGTSRGVAGEHAYAIAARQYREAEAYGRGDAGDYVIGARVSRRGVELASDGVGGCGMTFRTSAERRASEAFRDSTAWECIGNAIAEARTVLGDLARDVADAGAASIGTNEGPDGPRGG